MVSGVGGQYDFFAQAFALPDARAILTLNATRGQGKRTTSNIRWSYGHQTIPRHLRDVVVSEYGVADLRGCSDAQVIASLLNIADSRFDETEQRLMPALEKLQSASSSPLALMRLALRGIGRGEETALARMQLARPRNMRDRLYTLLLRAALRE